MLERKLLCQSTIKLTLSTDTHNKNDVVCCYHYVVVVKITNKIKSIQHNQKKKSQ
jgi:hypothetical protein